MAPENQAPTPPVIPTIDITPFTSSNPSPSAQQSVAKDLAHALSTNGCIALTGHGLSPSDLASAFTMTKTLFSLPYPQKMKAPHPDAPVPHRGYSGPGRENVAQKTALEEETWTDTVKKEEYKNVTKVKDFKESYEIGAEENKEQGNIWLPEEVFPGFREWGLGFYWEMQGVAARVLEGLIMGLDLSGEEAGKTRGLVTGFESHLRLLHYPPVGSEVEGFEGRLGAHTDWSLFTLLFQDEHGGLQFFDRKSGEFIDAVPQEGALYLNIGDMFERISNGFYPSAIHRVVIKNPNAPRYSIPFFVPPTSDGIIEPQPSLMEREGNSKYDPVTFREYSEQNFKNISVYG